MSTLRASGLLGVLILLLLVVSEEVAPSRLARAEPGSGTRLLVKCDRDAVPKVIEALAGLEVEVYDLDTMKRVAGAPSAAPTPASPPPDVRVAYDAVMAALAQAKEGELRLDRLEINARRATVGVWASELSRLDALRSDLEQQLHADLGDPEVLAGLVNSVPSGGVRSTFEIRFRDLSAGTVPAGDGVDPALLEAAVSAADLRELRVGPARLDGGWVTRELELERPDAGDLETQIRPLLESLSRPWLVREVSYRRSGEAIQRVRVTLVGRAAR